MVRLSLPSLFSPREVPSQLGCLQGPLKLSTQRVSPSLWAASRPSHPTFQVRTAGGRRGSHREERTEKAVPSMGGRWPAAAGESPASGGGWQLTREIVCILQGRARITLMCYLLQLFLPGVRYDTSVIRPADTPRRDMQLTHAGSGTAR